MKGLTKHFTQTLPELAPLCPDIMKALANASECIVAYLSTANSTGDGYAPQPVEQIPACTLSAKS